MSPPSTPAMTIASVERDTGLPKETLRVWERRYGFPAPERDAHGERLYPQEQVRRLRAIKRLLDRGHRPGKLMALDLKALDALAADGTPPTGARAAAQPDAPGPLLALVAGQDIAALRAALLQALHRQGLAAFITGTVAPLTYAVGEAWARGSVSVAAEHLYAEVVQSVLREALAPLARAGSGARVLLTTLPGEHHAIGLLMAEAVFALEGCSTVSMGVQTPLPEIVQAARSQQADIVALSFSLAFNGRRAVDGLAELRRLLPRKVALWAGGACPAIHRQPPRQVVVLKALEEIGPALKGTARPVAA